jgi:hypothetical protein
MQTAGRRVDWTDKLQNLLQVAAFCLAVATLQYGFEPDRPYGPNAVYSLCIGIITWAVIDIGREFIASAAETGWPPGMRGLLLVLVGIVAGYLLGNFMGDALCRALGLYTAGPPTNAAAHLRSSILVTATAGVAGSYYFYNLNKSAYLERKMSEARKHATEARLKLLETQLEPHMLFNTLANLRVLIGIDPPRAQHMLDRMIAYLRATLAASRSSTHTLQAEFDRLRDYLELMAVRMGPRLAYTLALPPELANHSVPTLLLQPLVENSIKHGLEPKVEGGRISVAARLEAGFVVLEVADTGVGALTGVASSSGPGFGLEQVRERLATQYGSTASFAFASAPGEGAQTVLRLPVAP